MVGFGFMFIAENKVVYPKYKINCGLFKILSNSLTVANIIGLDLFEMSSDLKA
jgi:hypothetical protein